MTLMVNYKLQASLSSPFLLTQPDLVTPQKGHHPVLRTSVQRGRPLFTACDLSRPVFFTYMPTIMALQYLFLKIMKISSTFQKYVEPLKSSGFCHSWKTATNTAFSIFPKSSWSVCAGTYQSHFWMHCVCVKDRNNADLLLEVLCMCVKDTKQKFLWSYREAANRIDWNQGAICGNVSCTMESMAESIDRTPAKPSTAKRRRFQTFEKAYHEKWLFVTIDKKGDTCVNSEVRSSVMKWLDWQTVKRDRLTAYSAVWNQYKRCTMYDCPVIFL